MVARAKSPVEVFLVMLAASAALFAQSAGSSPDKLENHASVLDARQIVGLSIAATERSWQARNHGAYKQDFGWIKVDGEVTPSFSMGLFVARMQRGSHIIMELTCVGNAVWAPKRLEMRASARILFLKSLGIDRILTYSDYRSATEGSYSVSR
jgi:hypothetical protein